MKHNFCQSDIQLHHSDYLKAFPCCDFYNISSVLNENEKYTHHLARYRFHRPKFEATVSQAAAVLEGFGKYWLAAQWPAAHGLRAARDGPRPSSDFPQFFCPVVNPLTCTDGFGREHERQ